MSQALRINPRLSFRGTSTGHRRLMGHQPTCRRNKTPALPLERQRNCCPYWPASREMSLIGHRVFQAFETGFEKWVLKDGWNRDRAMRGRGSFVLLCAARHGAVPHSVRALLRSRARKLGSVSGTGVFAGLRSHRERAPSHAINSQCAPCCQRDPRRESKPVPGSPPVDFTRAFGTQAACWSRWAYRCSGARVGVRAHAYVPSLSPGTQKQWQGVVP